MKELTETQKGNFWKKVNKQHPEPKHVPGVGNCWVWTACLDGWGYGQCTIDKKSVRVHRLSYTMHIGEIPEGMCVLHKCDNPVCVNPAHLFLGTHLDNVADRIAKNRDAKGFQNGNYTKPESFPKGADRTHAKLTDDIVRQIRSKFKPRKPGTVSLAKEYKVSVATISRIVKRETWRHVL